MTSRRPVKKLIKCKIKYDLSTIKLITSLNKYVFEDIFAVWGKIYRSAMLLRFNIFARGGGNWPPLAESTIKGRRKGKSKKNKGKVSILIDTGTLRNTLQPMFGYPGQVEEQLENGIRIGIGGNEIHDTESGLTIGELAAIHHFGGSKGKPPARTILVEPEEKTKLLMIKALDIGVQKVMKHD